MTTCEQLQRSTVPFLASYPVICRLTPQDIPLLGNAGSSVEVSPGFARNYLVPLKKASYLSPQRKKPSRRKDGTDAAAVSPVVRQAL